jgi:vacuolar-type H+-ATPase subunit I/STV1
MKKTFSLLAATVFTIQTLLPNTLIAQAAEPQTSMTPADITAALQSLEIAGLDDILDQIADYQGAFDLADFDLSQIPELAELIQQFTDSIPDDLAPALGNIDVNSLISQLFGSDLGEQAQQYLQNALTQIVNDTIARAKEVKLDELRSRVEQYIKTIAPDVISGTYTKEDAKLKITGAINTLIAEIEKEIFEYIYDTIVNEANLQTVYDEAYRLAYDDTAYQAAYDAVVASFDYDATYKTWLATLTQGTADCSIL